jgi:hypothetical protein
MTGYEQVSLCFMYNDVVLLDEGPGPMTVRKRASTEGEHRRLQHEASMLSAAAHPGVVELLSMEGEERIESLVLRRASGGALGGLGDRRPEVVAGIGAAVATTLADLHDIGFSHGAVTAEHILFDEEGRPLLCSFGAATAGGWGPELAARQQEDVRRLATVLLEWATEDGRPVPRALRAVLEGAATTRGRSRRGGARGLARALIEGVPGARLPGPGHEGEEESEEGEEGQRRDDPVAEPALQGGRVRSRAWLAVVPAGALLATILALTLPHGRPGRSDPVTCPAVDDGCGPVALDHGVLATPNGRFRLTATADDTDVAVLGRWGCGPTASPAVLRTGGQVWVFDAWPSRGTSETARLLRLVRGAVSLRVEPTQSGCDQLQVLEAGGRSVVLDPRSRAS